MEGQLNLLKITPETLKGKKPAYIKDLLLKAVAGMNQAKEQMEGAEMQFTKQIDEVRTNLTGLSKAKSEMNIKFNLTAAIANSGLVNSVDELEQTVDRLTNFCRKEFSELEASIEASLPEQKTAADVN